jgi:hypothetical protein
VTLQKGTTTVTVYVPQFHGGVWTNSTGPTVASRLTFNATPLGLTTTGLPVTMTANLSEFITGPSLLQ